ncbi:rod shape-determining protein MreC [Candidatus Parcubacteria bacterium]|jgi:rod shape-determining protein MreC|nr:rod shape-determining protein MreC [Candidatus Parcubacteria bacterium]MBT3949300.1 rod shape-determining protein MreC [Candidatus Parcubacteria bacterium]
MTSKKKTFVAILVIIIFTIFLHSIGWLKPLENSFSSLLHLGSKPFSSFDTFLDSRKVGKLDKGILVNNLKELNKELENNLVDKTQLELLKNENEKLRNQLQFFSSGKYNHIGAEVIGRTVDPLGTTIIIDKGEADGIFQNNPVIIGKGILIGKIISIEKHSAIVRLINDNTSRVGAMVLNGDKSIGLVEGGYGLSVHMNFIPQNEIVAPGDTIVTSGLTEGIPRGLVIGAVEIIEKQPHEPFQQAVLNPTADLSHLSVISVITHISNDVEPYEENT